MLSVAETSLSVKKILRQAQDDVEKIIMHNGCYQ